MRALTGRKEDGQLKGRDVIEGLKKKFRVSTDSGLAKKIGMTLPGIQLWKNRANVTPRQLGELVHKAHRTGAESLQQSAIRPLVEYFPIARARSKKAYQVFEPKTATGSRHQYLDGLRRELDAHCGIYLFFDSRGRAIYAGKARRQSLWREMNLAFNRDRGALQGIKRVRHPKRNQTYLNGNEKSRQIFDESIPLHEMAAYFSAYVVIDGMINELEAMLVRSFANDLLNKRMERFLQQKR